MIPDNCRSCKHLKITTTYDINHKKTVTYSCGERHLIVVNPENVDRVLDTWRENCEYFDKK